MELELFVFCHTEETFRAKNMGMTYSMQDCNSRPATFYTIDAIDPYVDEVTGRDYCCIYSSTKEFICTDDYETVKNKIRHAKNRL